MKNDSVQVKKVILEENLYYDKTIVLKYRIEYPQFFLYKYQTALNKINLYYKEKAYEVQRNCVYDLFREAINLYNYSVLRGYPIRQFEILMTYSVEFNKNCFLSLYYDRHDYMGGAHGNTVRASDTWNIQSGDRISLCDLFYDNIDCLDYVLNNIYKQINFQMKYNGNYMYFDNFQKNVISNFEKDNFYVTESPNGIIIYYQLYEIAPYSMGIPEFYMPYNPYAMVKPKCDMKLISS